ncbi:MAG TPA: DUF2971 domain-containing protein [Streptosporangiaceae bacterium]|nr:DUF2971 domain-containing protein [Streptosporangiaceae bacterium]
MIRDIALASGSLPAPGPGSDPEIIYHYTNATGLLGIVEKRVLWASDVWFMNDTTEGTYGREAIERYLRSKRPASTAEEDFRQTIIKILAGLPSEEGSRSYISCLSEKGDDLSQWRAYGGGTGVSVGFARVALEEVGQSLPSPLTFTLRKVAYRPALQETLLDPHYIPIASALPNPASSTVLQTEAIRFLIGALNLVPALKHPAFEDEAEFRVHVFLDPKNTPGVLSFRNSAMGVTPYIKVPLCREGEDQITSMRRIYVGPQRHPNESRLAIRQLLDANGLNDVEIEISKVPLRAA